MKLILTINRKGEFIMEARVMLVDDEQMVRDAVTMFFQEKGVKLITAASGDECLEYLEDGFRGVILMDVMMPEMNGWETIRRIVDNDLYEGNIIVMLTALDAPDNKIDGVQEYITDYLTKPFNPDDLMDTLKYYSALQHDLHTA